MKWIMAIWLAMGGMMLLGWTTIDIRHSMRDHNTNLGFAFWHWFARLPSAILMFGLLWPVGLGMAIHGHIASRRPEDTK